MGLFKNLKNSIRETKDLQTVLGLPREKRSVVVYSEDTFTWNQLGDYIGHLLEDHGREVVYVTGDPDDPLFSEAPKGMSVYYVKHTLRKFLPKLECDVFFTTMPDVGSLHIHRPPKPTHCMYAFHSLNSISRAYRGDAFDHYDAFFCTGEYMSEELAVYFRLIGKPTPEVHHVGYPKLDRIYRDHQEYRKSHPDIPTVVIAPSWGKNNALEICGATLVRKLLDAGLRVVVRPHPCFFLPIYRDGQKIVSALEKRFAANANFVLEKSINTEDSFHEADVMICDWSGSASEYTLGTARPVLFVDVPYKVRNPEWQKLGITPFEERTREEFGKIVSPENAGEVDKIVREMLDTQESFEKRVEELRKTCVYNFGRAAEAGARVIDDYLKSRG